MTRWITGICLLGVAFASSLSAQDQRETTRTMGPVSVRVALAPDNPVIGDTLELDLTVTAAREVEILMPEFGEALGRFQIIDFLPRETLDDSGQKVYSQKYRLQSPPSGEHAIPPILVEFVDRRPGEKAAPDGMDAYELFTERINFKVESVLVEDATKDLNPPLGRLEPIETTSNHRVSLLTYLGIGVGLLLVGCLLIYITANYRRRAKRKSAYEIARRQLDQLVAQKSDAIKDVDRFYVQLTTIVRQYLENRFELRAPELTTEEFLLTVSGSGELSGEHKKMLNNFLKHADLVKFAGLKPTETDVDESIEKASGFLEETRENAPLLVDPDSQKPGGSIPNQGGSDA